MGIFSAVVGGGLSYSAQETYNTLFGQNSSLYGTASLGQNLTDATSQYLGTQFNLDGLSALFIAAGIVFLILAILFLVSSIFGFVAARKTSKGLMIVNIIMNTFICLILFISIIWLIVEFASFTTLDALVGTAPAWMIAVTVLPEVLLLLALAMGGCWLRLYGSHAKM